MQELSYNAYTRKNMQAKANHSSMVWKLQRTSSNLKKKMQGSHVHNVHKCSQMKQKKIKTY